MSASVRVPVSRAYKHGLARGWSRADRMLAFDGVAVLPAREEVLRGLPFWAVDSEESDFLDGFGAGFDHRVAGLVL